jgi:large subunit ribosomal protein L25
MQSKTLAVEPREAQGKGGARKARAAGKIPAVIYGGREDARAVLIDHRTFDLLVRAGGHHGLLDVTLGGQAVKALVRDIQVHPVSRDYVHVDFQRVSMQDKIRSTSCWC